MKWDAPTFFSEIAKKRVAFIGAGVSHLTLIRLTLRYGAEVTVLDRAERAAFGEEKARELEALGATLCLGPDYLDHLPEYDVIFRSPGVYYHHPALENARRMGRVVTSEMEVFFELCPCKTVAVTGSDGKTTTTSLIAEMYRAAGKRVFLGGNIGAPLLSRVMEMGREDVAVVELSSFQLISMRPQPDVSVILNVTPNHLDVHGTMEEYVDTKRNLCRHQCAFSRTVLGAENDLTAAMMPLVRGEGLWFSRLRPVCPGAFLGEDGMLCFARADGHITELFPRAEIRVPGLHNVENMLAAVAAVWGEVPPEVMRRVAGEFGGVAHRLEWVCQLDGVAWYNDSIGTSPTRTIAGLRAFDRKVVLLAGGYDKQISFDPLIPEIIRQVKALVLMGETAGTIEAALRNHPDYDEAALPILHAADMAQAVETGRRVSLAGDVVLLSPACASFDRYPNFERRGDDFKEKVLALGESRKGADRE